MLRKKKKLAVSFAIVLFFMLFFKMTIYDNVDTLFMLAEGQNQPSLIFNMLLKRIYKIATNNDITQKISNDIEKGKNEYLYELYARVVGVVADEKAATTLLKMWVKYQDVPDKKSLHISLIRSIGLVGDTNLIPLLETLLDGRAGGWAVPMVVSSLYILTGEVYQKRYYVDEQSNNIRSLVANTKGRARTYREMMQIEGFIKKQ